MFSSNDFKSAQDVVDYLVSLPFSPKLEKKEKALILYLKEHPDEFIKLNHEVLHLDWAPQDVDKLSNWGDFIFGACYPPKRPPLTSHQFQVSAHDFDTNLVIDQLLTLWTQYLIPATEWPELFDKAVERCREYVDSYTGAGSAFLKINEDFFEHLAAEKQRLLKNPKWAEQIRRREPDGTW